MKKQTKEKRQVSDCCGASLIVISTGEGTNWYQCKKCGSPCDYKLTHKS